MFSSRAAAIFKALDSPSVSLNGKAVSACLASRLNVFRSFHSPQNAFNAQLHRIASVRQFCSQTQLQTPLQRSLQQSLQLTNKVNNIQATPSKGSFQAALLSRHFSSKRKSPQDTRQRVRAWADDRIRVGRQYFERRKFPQFTRGDLDKAWKKQRHRMSHVRDNMRGRQEELQRLKEKIKEKSKKAGKGALALWHQYGFVGIGVYLSIYLVVVTSFFTAASYGFLTAEQVKHWVTALHLDGHINSEVLDKVDTMWGRLAVAWIAAKVVEPLRLLLAVWMTPAVAKFLRRRGLKK